MIEKQHPQVLRAHNIEGGWKGSVYSVSSYNAEVELDTQELLLASDRLISDYSACFCDFETLNRPVIHYAYDFEIYKGTERKGAFDLTEVAAGPVVKTEEELLNVLAKTDTELLDMKGPKASYLVSGEKGKACENFAKWVGLLK